MAKYLDLESKLVNQFKSIALLVILISAAGIAPVFASPYAVNAAGNVNATNATASGNTNISPTQMMTGQSSGAITVTTDKASYNDGDKIMISGNSQDFISDTPVTIEIINPIGNLVKVDQVSLGSDRTYSTSITATGALWQAAGTWTVKVQLGSPDRAASTSFQFSGSAGGAGPTMKVDGTDFSVKYSITNGNILGMKIDQNSKSLMVSIKSTGDGTLTVTLPRGLIDATAGGKDSQFVVMIDGQESAFDETATTTTDRTLSIPFTNGATQIEIIGTFAIPEFGAIAAVVLAVAIVSIIAVSAKTGLRFMPRQ